MALTTEQQALAKQLGIDPSKWDWAKIVQMIQLLFSLFGNKQDVKTHAKAAGCPSDAHAEAMSEAICHNLQAADLCLHCCCPNVPPAPAP